MQQNNGYYGCCEIREGRERHYNRCNDRSHYKKSPQVYRKNPQEYSYKRNPQERGSRKSPQEHNKGFKPCRLHGEQANHTYEECCQNPCNQAKLKPLANYYSNKRAYDSHHQDSHTHDNRYLSSGDELRRDSCTLVPSDGKASASVGSKVANKNYHLSLDGKCPKRQRVTFLPRQSHKSDIAKLPKELKGSSDIE